MDIQIPHSSAMAMVIASHSISRSACPVTRLPLRGGLEGLNQRRTRLPGSSVNWPVSTLSFLVMVELIVV